MKMLECLHHHNWGTHASLQVGCPTPRPVQGPELGEVSKLPEGVDVHHRNELASRTTELTPESVDGGGHGYAGTVGAQSRLRKGMTAVLKDDKRGV